MLLKSGFIVSFWTLLCRLFGLAREFVIASYFGTSAAADCINVAFKLPNLFRRIFGEGALASVFVPAFCEKKLISTQEAEKFSNQVFSLLLVVLLIFTTLLEYFMPYIISLLAPGFADDEAKMSLVIDLCRITAPYILFISLAALCGSILNASKRFAAFAFSPILMSLSVIISIIYFSDNSNQLPYHTSYALIVAGILQFLFMLFCTYRTNISLRLVSSIFDSSVTSMVKRMGPATLSAGAQQVNIFISQSIASFIPGAVSILSYADRLYQLPLALIGISFSTILLPELSSLYKSSDHEKANRVQNKALQTCILVGLPAAVGLFIMSEPIIHLIYERGAFLRTDTILTAKALALISCGLPAMIIARIITPIFYANLDTKTPFKITIYSITIEITFSLLLITPLKHVGIAAALSITAWLNTYMLYRAAKRYGTLSITQESLCVIIKISVSALVMALVVWVAQNIFYAKILASSILYKIVIILAIILIGISVFIACCYILKLHKLLKLQKM